MTIWLKEWNKKDRTIINSILKKLFVFPSFDTINSDWNKGFVHNTIVEKEDASMSFLDLINIESDDLVAITSVFAVIVSIISIIFTVIFSIQQIKHNKNSVRPISSIQCSDYENLISVSIKNVGTGPLTINKLICKYKDIAEDSTLINLLYQLIPNINQDWDDYVENIDGWTISVCDEITLIEITPKNEEIKTKLRNVLKDITIHIDYYDIYNTRFENSRNLKFFGRHF